MEQTLKIKLSKAAHEKLLEMLKLSEEYTSIRFMYVNGCCKAPKVEISLDNFKVGDNKNNIYDLPILYDEILLDNIVELTIAHKDSRFWIKTISASNSNKHCSKENSGSCNGCPGKCGSH